MTRVLCLFYGICIIFFAIFVFTGKGVLKDCYETTPSNYDGDQNTTHAGKSCVRWDSVGMNYTNDQFSDATVSDAANFCRSLNNDYLWCWTDRYEPEHCGISKCGVVIDCYSTTPEMYDGHQQTALDGAPCLKWDQTKSFKGRDDLFPDASVSDAANFCRKTKSSLTISCPVDKRLYRICGITKCDEKSLSKCGALKVEEPAFLGRNVEFSFTPDLQYINGILEWQRSREKSPWVTRPLTYKFTQYFENGTYYMTVTDSTRSDEANYRIHYYNESMHCLMETTKLVLYDVPKQNFDEEERDDTTRLTLIFWVIIGSCSAFVVTAVIIVTVGMKIRGKIHVTSDRINERKVDNDDSDYDNLELVTHKPLNNSTRTESLPDYTYITL